MKRRLLLVLALVAVFAAIAAGSPVDAYEKDAPLVEETKPKAEKPEREPGPERPEPKVRGELEVIASGLDNPRGIDVGKRHKVYVAAAGRGGPTLVDTPLGDSAGPVCVGMTGSILKIHRGKVTTLINTPSAAPAVGRRCEGAGTGIAATGAHGIAVRKHHRISYTVGLGGTPEIRDVLAAAEPAAGGFGFLEHLWRPKADKVDVTGFEGAADPDMQGVDSNPYGLTRVKGGNLVVDAGGNTLLWIRRNGDVEVAAVFAPRCVRWMLGPNPIPPEANPCGDQDLFPADSVPTDVARHEDGDYLVTTLGGFPFVPGKSLVYKIDADHAGPAICSTFGPVPAAGCEVFADGLTALVGIDVDKNGKVYVVQMADNGLLGADSGEPGADAGSVQVLDADGRHVGAIEGLSVPGGIAIRGRKVYITNISIIPGLGQVIRAPIHCDRPEKCAAYS